MAVEILRVVLALPVDVVSGFGENDGAGLTGSLAVRSRIFHANLRDVATSWRDVSFCDGETAFAGAHLDAMIGDAQANGKTKGLAQPLCRGGRVGVDQHGDYGAGRDGTVRQHPPNLAEVQADFLGADNVSGVTIASNLGHRKGVLVMIPRRVPSIRGLERFLLSFGLASIACAAHAATAPADPCSLLSAAQVGKALGSTYGAPVKTVAPRPYANTVQGTDCSYSARGGGSQVLFRIYFDPSATAATDLFAKLKMFYSPPRPVSGVGDDTYFDPHHGIHVRKGNVRFFL